MPLQERTHLALAAKAEILKLNGDHDRVAVIGLDEIHVGGGRTGVTPQRVAEQFPATAQRRGFADRVIVLLIAGENPDALVGGRIRERSDDHRLGAGAGQHAIIQAQRVGDHARGEVVVQRHRRAAAGCH